MSRPEQSPKRRARKLLIRIAVAVLVGAFYYLAVCLTGKGLACPIYSLTGLSCPGCGVSRMAVALLQGDWAAAFGYHPVLFCSIVPLGGCFGAQAVRYVKTGQTRMALWQDLVLWTVVAALLLFCVYRNIFLR